jgi:hypothetical protein
VCVQSGEVGCGRASLLQVSLCVYCISSLRFSHIGGTVEVDKQRVCIKFCVRSGKTGGETFETLKKAYGDSCVSRSQTPELFGCSRMAELQLLTIDQVTQAQQQPPQKWNRYRRLSTRIVVVQFLCKRWNGLSILSANSHRTAENASDCSEDCAMSVDPGLERQSSSDLSGTEGNCEK